MNETLKARDFIVDFLRKELVGPSPGHPAVQIDGEEILRPQDPPRQRYGAGILFPMRAQVISHDETAESEDVTGDAESPEQDEIVASLESAETEPVETNPGEIPPETDRDVTLANEFLPSAMGLTALVEIPERLSVDVSAGSTSTRSSSGKRERTRTAGNSSPKLGGGDPSIDPYISLRPSFSGTEG